MVVVVQHLLVRIAGCVTANRGGTFICHPGTGQAERSRGDRGRSRGDRRVASHCSPAPRC